MLPRQTRGTFRKHITFGTSGPPSTHVQIFRERLHPELISELLRATVPTATDWWEFPCAKVGEERRVKCRVHTECEVVYER